MLELRNRGADRVKIGGGGVPLRHNQPVQRNGDSSGQRK